MFLTMHTGAFLSCAGQPARGLLGLACKTMVDVLTYVCLQEGTGMCATKPHVYHLPLQTRVCEHINHSLASQTQTIPEQIVMYRKEKHLYAWLET